MMIRPRTTKMLMPQATTLAMLPREPWWPALRMPQVGLMPTGAELASAETPVKALEEWCSNYTRRMKKDV